MTTQPTQLHWSSERFVPKFDRFWLPAGAAPQLHDWFNQERVRAFPRLRHFVAPSMMELTSDPLDWTNRLTYVSGYGEIPAEILFEGKGAVLEEFTKLVDNALWWKAQEDNVTLLTVPRRWVWQTSKVTHVYGMISASLAAPMLDLEKPI